MTRSFIFFMITGFVNIAKTSNILGVQLKAQRYEVIPKFCHDKREDVGKIFKTNLVYPVPLVDRKTDNRAPTPSRPSNSSFFKFFKADFQAFSKRMKEKHFVKVQIFSKHLHFYFQGFQVFTMQY